MSHQFFQNKDCEFFPCHPTDKPERFNCLFCFCPLYALGDACGGSFTHGASGVKDCSACLFPHQPEHYTAVCQRCAALCEATKKPPNTSF